jgi:hypothetical protein
MGREQSLEEVACVSAATGTPLTSGWQSLNDFPAISRRAVGAVEYARPMHRWENLEKPLLDMSLPQQVRVKYPV